MSIQVSLSRHALCTPYHRAGKLYASLSPKFALMCFGLFVSFLVFGEVLTVAEVGVAYRAYVYVVSLQV
jgi:hypothetical protein